MLELFGAVIRREKKGGKEGSHRVKLLQFPIWTHQAFPSHNWLDLEGNFSPETLSQHF